MLGEGGGVKRDHSLVQPLPPAKMIDNEYSMLDVADLVFIDPVSAGSMGEQFGDFGILKYALNIPHAAATAWYHHKLPSDLQSKSLREFLDEVEAFAIGEFAVALLQGNNLTPQKYSDMVAKVARYTGLTVAYVDAVHFRIDPRSFS